MSEQPPNDPPQDPVGGTPPPPPAPGQPYPSYGDYQQGYPPPPGYGQYQQYPSYPPPPPGYTGYGAPAGAPYDAGAAFGRAFRLFGRNAGPFVLVTLLIAVVAVVIGLASYAAAPDSTSEVGISGNNAGRWVLQIVGNIATTLISAALVKGALDAVDGRPVSFGAMFTGWNKVQVLIAALLTGILTGIGLVLLVLPGLILMFLLWYTNFFVVDEHASAFDAIGRSVRFTAAHVGPLLLTALLAAVVLIGGAVLCLVGLLAAYPIAMLLAAQAFRQLQGRPVVDPAAVR
jgi:hypothetical protein